MARGASWMAPDRDRGGRLKGSLGGAGQGRCPGAGASLPVTVIVSSRAGGVHPRGKTTNTLRAPAETYPSQVVVLHTYGSKLPESVAVPSALTDRTGLPKSPVKPTTKSTTMATTAITTSGTPQNGRRPPTAGAPVTAATEACSGALGGLSMALVRYRSPPCGSRLSSSPTMGAT